MCLAIVYDRKVPGDSETVLRVIQYDPVLTR